MKLTESQLFTIEALNRIEGFKWPEWANYAFMNHSEMLVTFTSTDPHIVTGEEHGFYDGDKADYIGTGSSHPDWKNSLITRTEFESADDWLRHVRDGVPAINQGARIDVAYCDNLVNCGGLLESAKDDDSIDSWGNVRKWRYRNQQDQSAETAPTHSIETLIGQHKSARAATLKARQQLDVAETAGRELMRDIEAWAESHGFDIRLLEGSEEKPELRKFIRRPVK